MKRRTKAKVKKLGAAVGKTMSQVKRTAVKVAEVTGAAVSTAAKRVRREIARRHLRQKMRRTKRALRAVAKSAVLAGTVTRAKAVEEFAAVRRA